MMNTQQQNIAWSDAMLTGIPSIDDQHQILVNMLNVANDKLIDNTSRVELEEIVRDLMSYALYHFDTEEALMLAYEYPYEAQQQHFQEHRNFSIKIAKLQEDINRGALVSPQDLLNFLKSWLIDHIMCTDKKLGQFLTRTDNP